MERPMDLSEEAKLKMGIATPKVDESVLAEKKKIEKTYQQLFGTANGKVVLEDLKKRCHYGGYISCENALITAQQIGERNALIYILKKIEGEKDHG